MYHIERKNLALSQAVAQAYPHLILQSHCYENVFRLLTEGDADIINPSWKIAFGLHGVHVPAELSAAWDTDSGPYYSEHMFFYNPDDTAFPIIDPSIPQDRNPESFELGYYVAAALSTREYMEALLTGQYFDIDYNPCFVKHMKQLLAWCARSGVRLYDPQDFRD